MSDNNLIELDDIDRAIISLLAKDSRMSFTKMSNITGYPDATIQHRFKRLLNNNVIKHFSIELNQKYSEHGVFSLVLLNTSSDEHDSVQKELEKLSEITNIYVVFGDYDFIVKVTGKSLENIDDIVRDKIKVIPGVSELRKIAIVDEIKHDKVE